MYFQFEADFVQGLRCIPMIVRYKLDCCGIKLKLEQWNALSEGDRQQLVALPCRAANEVAAYRAWLSGRVAASSGVTPAELAVPAVQPWETDQVPAQVVAQACQVGARVPTADQWRSLSPLQRFALLKLSQPSHENRNFLLALGEFGLANA